MATLIEPKSASPARELAPASSKPRPQDCRPTARRGRKWLIGGMIVVGLGGLGAVGAARLAGGGSGREADGLLTHKVSRGNLVVSITADGNLESAANIDVKCQVAGGSTILWIVPDGVTVAKGDVVCRLDSAALEDQIALQRITYERAQSTLFQAEKNVETAKIAVEEYRDGTYVKERKTLQSNVIVAEQNLKSAQDALHHAERMFKKGFVTALERESKEQGVLRAQLDVEAAKTALEVLERFTLRKTLEDLQSQVATAEATYRAEKAAAEAEKAKLERLEKQLEYCEIKAPQDGMVVYANELGGRRFGPQQSPDIQEGAAVRQGQSIVKIPDLSRMQVKVVVHESNVQKIRPGMPARIRLQGQELSGRVTSVANQPEASSWFGSNVKEYATLVKIEGQPNQLKPGMTAEVEIVLATLREVLSVPVTAVMERGGKFYCFAKSKDGPKRTEVLVGESSTTHMQIRDGLADGDEVYLNPRLLESRLQAVGQGLPDAIADNEGESSLPAGVEPTAGAGASESPSSTGRQDPAPPQGPTAGTIPAAAETPSQQPSPERGPGPGRESSGRRMPSVLQILQENDADKDGKLSKDEAPEPMKSFFDFMDSDRSGFVERAELQEAVNNIRRRMQSGSGEGVGDPAGRFPQGGGGG